MDYFDIENVTYQAIPLEEGSDKGIGINSSVFRAVRETGDDSKSLIVKVCNFANEFNSERSITRRARFSREIKAMELSKEKGKHNHVVRFEGKGEIKVKSKWGMRTHQCFLMEPARQNLEDYLKQETEISFQQRLLLCLEMIRSVRALHAIDVYHRDIKPGNILQCEEGWKIGDLGLVAFRNGDAEIDKSLEKIGPPTWMSPEAFNKAYSIQRPTNTYVDREFDERSDVYQLGKVCWYIIQGDIPNGCLKSKDLVTDDDNIFGVFLKPMLRYQRTERPLLSEVEERLTPLLRRHSG